MTSNGFGRATGQQSARQQLEDVATVMNQAGFYAYVHIDEQNRWSVSVDTEDGHADVRLGGGIFVIEAWDTSPGLFWDEEDLRRFHAKERRARIVMPAIARGILEPDQEIWWDEQDHGVGARVRDQVPFDEISAVPR
jgi:hypothetical protein